MTKMNLDTDCIIKLRRSRDVVFMEDQTIASLDKVEKAKPDSSDKLIDLEIIPLRPMADQLYVETQMTNMVQVMI